MLRLEEWLDKLGITTRLRWVAVAGLGICAGLGGYTFLYARGYSYLSNDPAVCANCHVMRPYYEGWAKATHHAVATCNDCHAPHDLLGKLLTKAENGAHHSQAFTLQTYPDTIRIRPKNAAIVAENCLRCHEEMVSGIAGHGNLRDAGAECVRCHAGVGHGLE